MDKRFLLFWVLVVLMWAGWAKYMEKFHPAPKRKPIAKAKAVAGDPKLAAKDAKTANGKPPAESKSTDKKPTAMEPIVPVRDDLTLGKNEDSPEAEFALFATLSNRGACVKSLQLNRYRDETRTKPLLLLTEPTPAFRSYSLNVEGDDGPSLSAKTWQVVESGPDKVVFRTTCLGGKLQIQKTFSLSRNSHSLDLEVTLRNIAGQPLERVAYRLMSGCGLPLEGAWYTQYFRNVHVSMKRPSGTAFWAEPTAGEIVAAVNGGKKPAGFTESAIFHAGVAIQYFASMVIPLDDQLAGRTIAGAQPLVVTNDKQKPMHSDIAVELSTTPVSLPPGGELSQRYHLYNGPKEPRALEAYAAHELPDLIHYGSFLGIPTGQIARFLAWVLTIFYSGVRDYGLAIMLLTVCVRSAMFPLSFRQAKSMQRMADLQPKIEELKKRYGSDKEKLTRAQMDLMAKEKVNPLGGCLPMFIQLPIFVGLYGAMSQNFNLRHSSFLWNTTYIKDLAAPDQLFSFGGAVLPMLGPYFNLLPVISVAQMVWQMKKFAPPATSPEMKMQQSMMMYMSIFMGFMFYLVPAGLCVYFITSGAWTFMERKFLPKPKNKPPVANGSSGGFFSNLAGEDKSKAESGPSPSTWLKPIEGKKEKKSRR